jgi:hypothetical protein
MQEMDPRICTVAGNTDCTKLYFMYWLGLLPYLHLDREAYLLPYMTADFATERWNDMEEAQTLGEKMFIFFYVYVVQLVNMMINPCLVHLQRRGIYTAFWTINCPNECEYIL